MRSSIAAVTATALIGLAGCSTPALVKKARGNKAGYRLGDQEEGLQTNRKGDWIFHRVAEDSRGLGLKYPGYLIGLEKSYRKTIAPSGEWPDDWIDFEKSPFRPGKLKRFLHITGVTKGVARRSILTHIFEYGIALGEEVDCETERWGRVHAKPLYDVYSSRNPVPEDPSTAFAEGFKALDILRGHLGRRIDTLRATHILLYTMGWNTDQEEAIRNINSLVGFLMDAASGEEFRPLVIAVTWDSGFGENPVTRVPSYFGKANDADEVGAVWVNRLLRQAIFPAKGDTPLVVVGHSFGARVVTTALASGGIATETVASEWGPAGEADLVVLLQGALSVNRFIEGRGWEGSPLRAFEKVSEKTVLTWSMSDTANPKANLVTRAAHAGGWPAFERAGACPERFEFRCWKPDGDNQGRWSSAGPPTAGRRAAMVNVSSIVDHLTYNKGGRAHSDIYSQEMGELMWALIQQFTMGIEPPSSALGDECAMPWTPKPFRRLPIGCQASTAEESQKDVRSSGER